MECRVVAPISALATVRVESVGRCFESLRLGRGRIENRAHTDVRDEKREEQQEDIENEDPLYYLTLDPKEWKSQDHYAVLGLDKLRFAASDDDIKKAYKKKVLKHHPDKKNDSSERQEDDFFTCIKRAYEVLGDPVRRRAYDSIDPHNDDTIPTVNSQSKEHFFEVFTPVFEVNGRWSKVQPVPQLGTDESTIDRVNDFYLFWYAFDSWREFSYLDEEDTEKAESREERRWLEKQNKAVRQARRREEVTRIRTLVDNAYACDPRVKRFKDQEKQRKLAEKKAKQEAAKAAAEEKERATREAEAAERKAKEEAERQAKEEAAIAKKEKEAKKKEIKKERKSFRSISQKHNNFSANESEVPQRAEEIDMLCQVLSVERLQALREKIEECSGEAAKQAFVGEVERVKAEDRMQRESAAKTVESQPTAKLSSSQTKWSEEEHKLLVKAVQRYPAGTVKRWEQIALFITSHIPSSTKTADDVIIQMKRHQSRDDALKLEANQKAFAKFSREHIARVSSASVSHEPTQRFDGQWSADEQKRLEEALRGIPTSAPDRWERIASHVGRSKKDCVKRCKEVAKMLQAKKGDSALK